MGDALKINCRKTQEQAMKLTEKINRMLPRDTMRRKAAKSVFRQSRKLKKNRKSVLMVYCEDASFTKQGLNIRGWILTSDDDYRLELYMNDKQAGTQIPEISRPDIADFFFFVDNWVCAGFDFTARCDPQDSDNEIIIKAVSENNIAEVRFPLPKGKSVKYRPVKANVEQLTKRIHKKNDHFGRYVEENKIKKIQHFLSLFISLNFESQRPELIIGHRLGGGSNYYRESLIREKTVSGGAVVLYEYDFLNDEHRLEIHQRYSKSVFSGSDADNIVRFLKVNDFKGITVNNLVSFPKPERLIFALLEIRKRFNSRITLPVHDYYPVCPSYNLIDNKGKYCGIPDEMDVCEHCLKTNKTEELLYRPESMKFWRDTWGELLESADEILCFSESSKKLILRAYPRLSRIKVRPHIVPSLRKLSPSEKGDMIIIGIPGRIHYPKGSRIIEGMAREIRKRGLKNVKIIIIGELADINLSGREIEITGAYLREALPEIIDEKNVNIIFIPSIWPETFSYTTEEAMLMELPVAVFNLGAPAERVRGYAKGLVIEEIDPVKALDAIIEFYSTLK